jgi:hypothetical protein
VTAGVTDSLGTTQKHRSFAHRPPKARPRLIDGGDGFIQQPGFGPGSCDAT